MDYRGGAITLLGISVFPQYDISIGDSQNSEYDRRKAMVRDMSC